MLLVGWGRWWRQPSFEHRSVPDTIPPTSFTSLGGREHDAHMTGVETEALTNRFLNEAGSGLALILLEKRCLHCRELSVGRGVGMDLRSSHESTCSVRQVLCLSLPVLSTVLGSLDAQ